MWQHAAKENYCNFAPVDREVDTTLSIIQMGPNTLNVILCLHYVPVGHGSHVSDNRDQKGINVRQRRGTGLANVARRENRGHRGKSFDS